MNDFRTLLAELREDDDYIADDILTTRIPDLCPDCKGSGINRKAQAMNNALATELFLKPEFRTSEVCTHPNAPTIADLLRWGENVARAHEHPDYPGSVLYGDGETVFAVDLLAALRGEGQ